MQEKELEIINKLGLHARAAAKLVSTAAGFGSRITLQHGGNSADAKSIMSVMMLAAAKGSVVKVTCEGEDEVAAMQAIEDLIGDYFGEEG